jgi:alkanesulfonate monooxygenase SsuD/methylene tetrahydromethanopterin reductase-like flavin-dependent oxidoreductase (luciferase family)
MARLEEIGIHLTTHLYEDCQTDGLVEVAKLAHDAGLDSVTISDNLRARNPFVILAAMAARVPIQLGTGILVPYFRNPLDVASCLGSISEFAAGDELAIGIARGSHLQTSRNVQVVKPLHTLREFTLFLKRTLDGEEVSFDEYPALSSYFSMRPGGKARLDFEPKLPVKIYCGGNGPRTLGVAGEVADGLMFGGQYIPFLTTNKLQNLFGIYKSAARKAGRSEEARHIALIAISIGENAKAARDFTRPNVASSMMSMKIMGFTDADFRKMGVEPASVDRLIEASRKMLPVQEVVRFVTDAMVDATYVAGDGDSCRDRFVELCEATKKAGIKRIQFSKLGPKPKESVKVITKKILPALR